ncbi:hypothetical protein FHS21_004905 [Phyllobacterium trifolii]|uniref:Transcriptional regulator n=1 Tax=Phyllobacterium trifolii TaxID=300193 RepID=A0A839UBV0_9HYPH|nr:hypothetical protein [Phyllobacterium trifolii]
MTPQRFVEALECVRWTRTQIAEVLRCDISLVEAWANEREKIPVEVGAWLESLAEAHEASVVPRTCREKRAADT